MNCFTDIDTLKKLYKSDIVKNRGDFLKKYSNRKYSIRDIVIKYYLDSIKNKRILDIGPGDGSFLRRLLQLYNDNQYFALDIVKSTNFNESKDIKFSLYDGKVFPYMDNMFDVIICMHMLYHVQDINSFLCEVKRIMKSSGFIIITTKSLFTMPHIEAIFMSIVHEMNLQGILDERDEKNFCSENAREIIEKIFFREEYKIEIMEINSQLFVDDTDELMTYILSTMRYNLQNKIKKSEYEAYINYWKKILSKERPFIDEVKECILVIQKR